jgi:hypothetical protein
MQEKCTRGCSENRSLYRIFLNLKSCIHKEYKMSATTERKTYKSLCDEHESILEEIEAWRISGFTGNRMGLWSSSTYLDELLYIRKNIEKDMIPHQIVMRMKFYKRLMYKTGLPTDIVLYIASFGDFIDVSAMNFLRKGVKAALENVVPIY